MACGCNDTALPLANCNDGCDDCPPTNATNLPDCPDGSEPCEELVYTDCTKYKGPNLPVLEITNNMRLIEILTKLHKIVNALDQNLVPVEHTATCTTSTPLKITYLDYGPDVFVTSSSSSGAIVTVSSTSSLQVGMKLVIVSGPGVLGGVTEITSILSATTVGVSPAPTTPFANTALRFYGSDHTIKKATVLQNYPLNFFAFEDSPVILSGTGTITLA